MGELIHDPEDSGASAALSPPLQSKETFVLWADPWPPGELLWVAWI